MIEHASTLTIKEFPEWTDRRITDTYKITFKLIGDRILLSIPDGDSGINGITLFIEERKKFLQSRNIYESSHVEIKDYSRINGKVHRSARQQFTQFLLNEQERGYLKAFYGFDSPFLVKTVYNLGLNVFKNRIPIRIYNSFEEALSEAVDILKSGFSQNERNLIPNPLSDLNTEEQTSIKMKDINDLYNFIGSINWESIKENFTPVDLPETHPLAPIYGALRLLNIDFHETLDEQHRVERKLHHLNEKMEKIIDDRTKRLLETNTIMETSLNVLSHDTNNLFMNISYLIDQELDEPIKSSFRESYDELYESVMEATGYIKDKKRIFSIINQIERINLTEKRIPLRDYPNIEINITGEKESLYLNSEIIIKNAIVNLLENAIKYTPEGSLIKLSIYRQKDDIIIEVIDQGDGIPEEDKKHLIDKGFRRESDVNIEGSGRGLWISHNIVNKSKGHLTIHDNPEGGTIFRISLPAFKVFNRKISLNNLSEWFQIPIDEIEERFDNQLMLLKMNRIDIFDPETHAFISVLEQLRSENKKKPQMNIRYKLEMLKKENPDGKTVLIVDDSLFVHYYLATYLVELGYRIIDFEFNGQDGVDAYMKYKPDLITLDNTMPVLTGVEAARLIYKYDNNAKILFVTALGDSTVIREEIQEYIPVEDFHIISKPFSKEKLSSILSLLSFNK